MILGTTVIAVNDEEQGTSQIAVVDTIEHDGCKWLVPEWLEAPSQGWKKPARIVRPEKQRFERPPKGYDANFVLSDPVPKSVLFGPVPSQQGNEFFVVDAPDIEFPIPRV